MTVIEQLLDASIQLICKDRTIDALTARVNALEAENAVLIAGLRYTELRLIKMGNRLEAIANER